MSKIKEAPLYALFAAMLLLSGMYFADQLNEPMSVSPETAEFISLNKGLPVEEAKHLRALCAEKGCYFGDDGSVLVNQN